MREQSHRGLIEQDTDTDTAGPGAGAVGFAALRTRPRAASGWKRGGRVFLGHDLEHHGRQPVYFGRIP
jgi:hypothetical protein